MKTIPPNLAIACRKRRIKCGEEKPRCSNCIKSKRECEGYAQRVIFRHPVGPIPHLGPIPQVPNQPGSPDFPFWQPPYFRPLPDSEASGPRSLFQPLAPRPIYGSVDNGYTGSEFAGNPEEGSGIIPSGFHGPQMRESYYTEQQDDPAHDGTRQSPSSSRRTAAVRGPGQLSSDAIYPQASGYHSYSYHSPSPFHQATEFQTQYSDSVHNSQLITPSQVWSLNSAAFVVPEWLTDNKFDTSHLSSAQARDCNISLLSLTEIS